MQARPIDSAPEPTSNPTPAPASVFDGRTEPIAAAASNDGAVDGPHRTEAPAPPTQDTGSIDWDVATAAALTDEPGERAATVPHTLPKTSPDQLLEDLIREIVGDAAADTVSALQTPQPRQPDAPTGAPAPPPPQTPSEPALTDAPATWSEPGPDPDVGSSATVPHPAVHPDVSTTNEVSAPPPSFEPATPDTDVSEASTAGLAARTEMAPDEQSGSETTTSPATVAPGTLDPRESGDETTLDRVQTDPPSLPPIDIPASVSRETSTSTSMTTVSRETVTQYGGTPLADQLADETRRRQALDEEVLPLPARTRVMTISNQKGGVGKTTTAVNLAAALARTGAHVLVIDLDPQGNASTALGVDHRSEQQSVYEVLVADLPLSEVIKPSTEHESLDCVPATIHLAGAEIELVSLVAREQRLRRALDTHLASMVRPYDYVFIDCPPSLGLLTINAFVAAREVLIPIQCEYYALEGLSQLLSNIELIEKHLNPELRLSTILLTMYDSRTNLAQQVAQEVRDHFPTQTLSTIIPRSVRVSEAPSYGQSVISYDFASSGSLSYREAAAEIARRGYANQNTQKDSN